MNEVFVKKQLSATDAIDRGWKITLAHFGSILLLTFIFGLTLLLIAFIFSFLTVLIAPPDWATYPAQLTINTLTALATATTTLKLADGQKLRLSDLFSQMPLFFRMLIANILYLLAVLLGFICLVIPGVILAIRLNLFDLFIIDQGCGPIEALRKSYQTLRGNSWRWAGFLVLSFLILLLGLLFFGIGLLVAAPTVLIARALLYRNLIKSL